MISFLKLIRTKNLLMVLLTMYATKYALIEFTLDKSHVTTIDFSILALSILLITAGGYIINDICDVEVDQINKPNKVFIGNTISVKRAWIVYLTMSFIGLGLGTYVSIQNHLFSYTLFFVITFIGLYIYSKYLQRILFLGNLMISLLCSLIIYLVYSFDFTVSKRELFIHSDTDEVSTIQIGMIGVGFYMFFSFISTLNKGDFKRY